MNLRSTTHSWIGLALLLSACGGKAFTSDQSSDGVGKSDSGAESPAEPSTPAPGNTTPPGADPEPDPGQGAEPADPGPEPGGVDPGTGTDEPAEPDPSDPQPEPPVEVCPVDCPVIAICQLCDDGSCAVAKVNCNPDGSCGSVDWECAPGSEPEPVDPEPVDPGPVEPDPVEYEPCAGLTCGEPCDACAPGVQCIIGAGFCDAEGQCLPSEPECEMEPTCDCPIPRICQLCDDGSCATGIPHCNAAGECEEVEWECAEVAECQNSDECVLDAACVECENGELWCPEATCKNGQCGSTPNLSPESYEPCAGKEDGDACQHCSPLDKDCIETDELKACNEGLCSSEVFR